MPDLSFPGEFPYTRGVQPTMYRGRLWSMRQTRGMKRYTTNFNPFAAAKFVITIEDNLITFKVTVIIGDDNCIWMVVQHPWYKRTDNKIVPFESLVDWWR